MNVVVNQILCPVKLAFIIPPNKRSSYLRAIRMCSSLWGGRHFPILTFYKNLSKDFREEYGLYGEAASEYYNNALSNFDPQFIIVDPQINEAAIKKLKINLPYISIEEIEKSIQLNETKYGISIEEVLQYLKEKDFKFHRTDSFKVTCPIVPYNDLFTATLCGTVSLEYQQRLRHLRLSSEYISFPKINKQNFTTCLKDGTLDYLGLGSYGLQLLGNPIWSSQYCVYFVNPDRLNDLINIWNLRALGWHVVAIPFDGLKEPFYQGLIKKQQEEFNSYTQLIDSITVIQNSQLESDVAHALVNELSNIQKDENKRVQYISQHWFPRFWLKSENLSYDKSASILIQANSKKTLLTTFDQKIKIEILRPPFLQKYVKHTQPRFINEVSLDFEEERGKYAQIFPDMKSEALDFVIRGSGFSQWHFSKGIMYFLSHEQDEYLEFTIPEAREVFEKWFEQKEIQIRHSAPGKLANELLKNIGGILGTNFFANPGIPPILGLFENGRVRLKKALDAEINRQLIHFREKNKSVIIQKLLTKKIIEFGQEVQCVFCNKHSFYKLDELSEKLRCPVCHNLYNAPIHTPEEMKPAYRGLGPFSKNNKAEGLISVLLTLRFFKISLHPSFITPLLSFELLQNNVVVNEVDIGIFFSKYKRAFSPTEVFFCECKTEIDFAKKDIDKMEKLGKLFPNAILTFATLKNNLSETGKAIISILAGKFRHGIDSRPTNPVLILTGNELLPKTIFGVFDNLKQKFPKEYNIPYDIVRLCDLTCQLYLGLPSYKRIISKRINTKIEARQSKK